MNHHHAARLVVPLAPNGHLPGNLSVASIERGQMSIRGSYKYLVLIQGHATIAAVEIG